MKNLKIKINSGFTLWNTRQANSTGFTLIELLLYVSLSAIILLSVSNLLATLLQARVKNQVMAEVEQAGIQALQIITQTARNATNINSPATSTSAALLSVNTAAAGNNPTVFDLAGGALRVTEGAGAAVRLTNPILVTASGINFQNFTKPSTPGIIRVSFTLTYINSSGRNEYNYAKTFYASASRR